MRTDDILGIAHLLKSGTDSPIPLGILQRLLWARNGKPGSGRRTSLDNATLLSVGDCVVFYSPSTNPSFATDQSTMEGPTFPEPSRLAGLVGSLLWFWALKVSALILIVTKLNSTQTNQLWASIIMSSLCILLVHCLAVIKVLTGEI